MEKSDTVTVSQYKTYFENLAVRNVPDLQPKQALQKSHSSVEHSIVSAKLKLAPAKPQRTFVEDHYFDPQTLKPIINDQKFNQKMKPIPAPRRNVVVAKPIFDVSTVKRSKTVKELMQKFSEENVNHRVKQQDKLETPSKVNAKSSPLNVQPKYFQLSHDYEEVFMREGNNLKNSKARFSSVQNLLSVEIDEKYDQLKTDKDDNAHYASASIVGIDVLLKLKHLKASSDSSKPPQRSPFEQSPYIRFSDIVDNKRKTCSKDNPVKQELPDEEDSDKSDTDNAEIVNRISRARIIRRKSILHYEHQETTFLNRKAPQLFELAVLIELVENDKKNPRYLHKFMPTYRSIYPPSLSERYDSVLDILLCLSYPNVNIINSLSSITDDNFVITLTDELGDRKFAYYHRFLRADRRRVIPTAFCVLSPVQAGMFYRGLAREASDRVKIGNVKALMEFLNIFYSKSLPPANGCLRMAGTSQWPRVLLINRHSLSEIGSDLHMILEKFGVDDAMKLFASLLVERRIVLIGGDVTVISRIVQAAVRLLAPFSWPHTLIPVVPDCLLEMTELPSPYIMGVLRSSLPNVLSLFCKNPDAQDDEYLFIYDIDHGILKDGKDDKDNNNKDTYKFFQNTPAAKRLREKLDLLKTELPNLSLSPPLSSYQNDGMDGEFDNTNYSDSKISNAFLIFFAQLLTNYREFLITQKNGVRIFQKSNFVKSTSSKAQRRFLRYFIETGMFQVWINRKIENNDTESIDQHFDEIIFESNRNKVGGKRKVFNKLAKHFYFVQKHTSAQDIFSV